MWVRLVKAWLENKPSTLFGFLAQFQPRQVSFRRERTLQNSQAAMWANSVSVPFYVFEPGWVRWRIQELLLLIEKSSSMKPSMVQMRGERKFWMFCPKNSIFHVSGKLSNNGTQWPYAWANIVANSIKQLSSNFGINEVSRIFPMYQSYSDIIMIRVWPKFSLLKMRDFKPVICSSCKPSREPHVLISLIQRPII